MLRKMSLLHSNNLQAKYLSLQVQLEAKMPDFAFNLKAWQAVAAELTHAQPEV